MSHKCNEEFLPILCSLGCRHQRQIERLTLYVNLNECVLIHFNKPIYLRLGTVHSIHSQRLQSTHREYILKEYNRNFGPEIGRE